MFPAPQRRHSLLRLLSLLLLSIHSSVATQFSVNQPNTTSSLQPTDKEAIFLQLSTSLADHVFGLSPQGLVTASLQLSLNISEPRCPARVALCLVSDIYVRGPSYERRQPRRGAIPSPQIFADRICKSDSTVDNTDINAAQDEQTGLSWCISRKMCAGNATYNFSVQTDNLQPNQMYQFGAALCHAQFDIDEQSVRTSIVGNVQFRNPDLLFPQLGYEEVLFPVFSPTVIILLGLVFFIIAFAQLFVWRFATPIRYSVIFVMIAVFLKLLGAILTFVYFWGIAQTGTRHGWYLYVRLLLSPSADVAFIIALVSISSGFAVMPNSWFVEDRSPIFLVYIGIVLQLLIVIAVKIMYPLRYLGAATYSIAGTSIALIASYSSYRIRRFLERYSLLIERSHILLKTTPVSQMRRFYTLNIGIIAVAYLGKIVSVGLFDYLYNRPDFMWGLMELIDAALLVWFGVFIFPHRKSAVYVDMSHLSNDRLHQAERWRARQTFRQTSNEIMASMSSAESNSSVHEGGGPRPSSTSPDINNATTQLGTALSPRQTRVLDISQPFLQVASPPTGQTQVSVEQNPEARVLDSVERFNDRSEPQPPWIAWASGASLPRPDRYTWRGHHREGGVLRRESRRTPFLRTPIVVGSPEDSTGDVKLTVGIPITGTNVVPKAFDEKGAEIRGQPPREGLLRSDAHSSGSGSNRQLESRSSHSDIRSRLGYPSRRHGSGDPLMGEGQEQIGGEVEIFVAQKSQASSSNAAEIREESRADNITRNLSSSSTAPRCDGTVSVFGISDL